MKSLRELIEYLEEAIRLYDSRAEDSGMGNDFSMYDELIQEKTVLESIVKEIRENYELGSEVNNIGLVTFFQKQYKHEDEIKKALNLVSKEYKRKLEKLTSRANSVDSLISAFSNIDK
jgi:anaerobic ribonucleoside-triphosphate reductase